jgi:hypothetical protein
MATQPYLFTTFILGSACIGDSRTTINASFSALDTAVQTLSSGLFNTSISATGAASVSALQINSNIVINSAVGGSQSKKFPIYDQNGSFIGYLPLYSA